MNRIKELRTEKKMSMKEAAAALALPYTTYVGYEKGEREPNSEMLIKIATFFEVSVDYLICRSDSKVSIQNVIPYPTMTKVPLIGDIACGEPILAEENIVDYVNMPKEIAGTFALRCHGDSMINARIFDGDLVFIHQQPEVENGEIAAVLIDNEATLKRFFRYDDRIELRAENPTFRTLTFVGPEMARLRILGKAVAFTSYVR